MNDIQWSPQSYCYTLSGINFTFSRQNIFTFINHINNLKQNNVVLQKDDNFCIIQNNVRSDVSMAMQYNQIFVDSQSLWDNELAVTSIVVSGYAEYGAAHFIEVSKETVKIIKTGMDFLRKISNTEIPAGELSKLVNYHLANSKTSEEFVNNVLMSIELVTF